jgi:ABC-type polysaccharide/polyol phosphate export permease
MLVYAFVFGVIFHASEPHQGLFIFVGLSVWQFFSKCIKKSVVLVKKNKQIIGKVYIPKYILLLQEELVNGFKMGICLLISAGMIIFYRVGFTWEVLLLVPVVVLLVSFSFGVGCFLLHFGVYLEDLSNITDIVLRLVMYFVGVFYSIPKRIPAPYNTYLLKWNPIAFIVECVRNILIYHKPLDYVTFCFWLVMSLVLSYAGIQLIYKNENSYIKVI